MSQVTGRDDEAAGLVARWGRPLVESMEGAAAAHVCALYGVPFLEVRGISNLVGDRDRAAWDVEGAAARAGARSPAIAARLTACWPRPTACRRRARRVDAELAPLSLVYSPCPNDTFIFHAWVHGLLPGAPAVRVAHHDIDTLNGLALAGEPDVIKVSFHAFGHLRERYALLHCGGALGRGCGPLMVVAARTARSTGRERGDGRLALPGRTAGGHPRRLTTAALLLRLYAPELVDPVMLTFDRIMPAVAAGEVDAGLIIHEGRFTYPLFGLSCLVDLGEWWERTTGLPIPLGGIVVRRELGSERAAAIDAAVVASLVYARSHPTPPPSTSPSTPRRWTRSSARSTSTST